MIILEYVFSSYATQPLRRKPERLRKIFSSFQRYSILMWVASELRWDDEGEESDAGMIDLLIG